MSSSRAKTKILIALPILFMACRGDSKLTKADSANLGVSTLPAAARTGINTGWNDANTGPFLILAAEGNPLSAAVVLPDETDSSLARTSSFQLDSLSGVPVDLFGEGGAAGHANLTVVSQKSAGEGCVAWPLGRLAGQPTAPWTVGFVKGRATAMQLDSIEGMNGADSSFAVTELTRIASAASTKSDPVFQGLPFIVQKAYRVQFGKTSIVIGSVVRKINEEAAPREENVLVVAEKSDSSPNYVSAFQSRTSGTEDDVRTNGVVAAVHFVQTNRPALVLSFEYDDGGQIALLERMADHDWRITWRSAYTGC